MTRRRVAILISGRGSNMGSLIAAAADPDYPAQIIGVISNRPEAAGLARAEAAGLPIRAIDHRAFPDRAAFDAALEAALVAMDAEFVCLAGFMRLLTPDFCARWERRMLNIHPSLLPAFPGLNTHARALAAGVKIHGCTVHYVTAELDAGPIIAQAAVPTTPGDDPDTLAARVLAAEHKLYPHALRLAAEGAEGESGAERMLIAPAL